MAAAKSLLGVSIPVSGHRAPRTARTVATLAAALAATLAAPRARADEPKNASEEVRVEGRRSQAGGFVSERRLEDAPREVTDAASLVEPLPGVHVRRLGADDSFATLSIRGSSSTQVAVFLAGVPLSGGADPTLDLATLPLWPGARARVHRSFAPAGLGRGSLGGTLVIDPPSAKARAATDVWLAAGAFGARRLRLGDVRGDPDGVRVATGLSASRSDDDFDYLDPSAAAAGRELTVTRENAGHAAAAGLVSVAIPVRLGKLPRPGALTLTNLAQARRQELPGTARVRTPLQRLDSSRLVSALELAVPLTARDTFSVRGWGRREGLELTDRSAAVSSRGGPQRTDDMIVAAGGSVGVRGAGERGSIEVRLDGSAERFAPSWSSGLAPPAARRTNAGAALDATFGGAEEPRLSLSGRVDAWFDTADDGGSAESVRPTGNVGSEIPLGPVVLAAHAGYVARPPSFVERYGNRGAFLGNAALATETAVVTDAGARFERTFGALRVAAEAATFTTWARDLITFVVQGADGRAKAQNIGRAFVGGVEAELRARLYGFEARASHTALHTANQAECTFVAGRCERPPLPGRPAHDFVADLAWTGGPLRLRYGVDVVAGIRADLDGAIEVPTRVLHSAGARVAVPKVEGLSLSLDVRNLFDLRAAEYTGPFGPIRAPIGDLYDYPLPGRRVLLSARLFR